MSSQRPFAAGASTIAHDEITPLIPILDAFNHRHRNQHHSSHWWSAFSILRRATRTLAADLVDRQENRVLSRARWLKRHVAPRCYVSFSQLAADNQHAPLGLMLLAVLARLSATLAALLLTDKPPATVDLVTLRSREDQPSSEVQQPSGADRGMAVSRHDVAMHHDQTKPSEPLLKQSSAKSAPSKSSKSDKKRKKSSSKKGDEFSSLFGSLG